MLRRVVEPCMLAGLIAIHLLLGVYYSMAIPIWEAHDEIGHYYFVRYLANEHRLPAPGQKLVEENDESRQPPLYYLLAALPAALVGANDGEAPHINPHMMGWNGQSGYNRAIHDPTDESWPYRGTVLNVHVVRLASIVAGALALIFAYLLARELFPAQPLVRWGTLCTMALWPQFRFATAVINNDIAAAAAGAAIAWLLVRAVRAQRPTVASLAGLGLAAGLGLLTKNTVLPLLPIVAVVSLVLAFRLAPATRGRLGLCLLGGAVLGLGLVGWSYARNVAGGTGMFGGYGLDTVRMVLDAAFRQPQPGLRLVLPALQDCLRSFWAIFGWGNLFLPSPFYWAAAVWSGLAAGGLLLWCLHRPERQQAVAVGVVGALVAGTVGGWLLFMSGTGWRFLPGRYLLPALPAVSPLLALGWTSLLPARARAIGWACIVAGLGVLALLTPVLYIQPAYALPPQLSPAQLSRYAPADYAFGGYAKLTGYHVASRFVDPGGTVHLDLAWRVLAQTETDYTLAVQVFDGNRNLLGEVLRYPGRGAFATSSWRPGYLYSEEFDIRIGSAGKAGCVAAIEVSFFVPGKHSPVDVYDAAGHRVGYSVPIERIRVRGTVQAAVPAPSPNLRFGEAIRLVGAQVDWGLLAAEPRLEIDLEWLAAAVPARDYTVSLQLRDDQDRKLAQVDSQPQQGKSPTSLWEANDVTLDHYVLPLPKVLAAGTYRLYTCLYDLNSMQRLPVTDLQGQGLPHDEASLLTVTVESGGVPRVDASYPLVQIGSAAAGPAGDR